jgi:hypothetical protein
MQLPLKLVIMKKIKILFDIMQEYYWPSMAPIYKVLSGDERYELSLKIGL